MEKQVFTNEVILDWLHYYAKNTALDLEHVKILDITRKNKNIIQREVIIYGYIQQNSRIERRIVQTN